MAVGGDQRLWTRGRCWLSPPNSQGVQATGSLRVQIKASRGGQLSPGCCLYWAPTVFLGVPGKPRLCLYSQNPTRSVSPLSYVSGVFTHDLVGRSPVTQCLLLALTQFKAKAASPHPLGHGGNFAFCLLYVASQSWVAFSTCVSRQLIPLPSLLSPLWFPPPSGRTHGWDICAPAGDSSHPSNERPGPLTQTVPDRRKIRSVIAAEHRRTLPCVHREGRFQLPEPRSCFLNRAGWHSWVCKMPDRGCLGVG